MNKLDLICSKDELRPVMGHVLVTKENCVATDAHVMGIIPTAEIFDAQFIEQLGETPLLIFSSDWKKMNNATGIMWKDRAKNIIEIFYKKGRPALIEAETEEKIAKYPNWKAVIPETPGGETEKLCFSPTLLLNLTKALGFEGPARLEFCDALNRPIRVTECNKESKSKAYGIIMPVMDTPC